MVNFTDETIQKIFGFEDAESEPISRLKEYYLKKDTYDSIIADLPLRILVGHKGTGKSALFKVAMSEEREKGNLPILIKPDDIAELGKSDDNFLLRIRQWKYGMNKIIGEKVFREVGIEDEDAISRFTKFGVKLLTVVSDTFTKFKKNVSLEPTQKAILENYLKEKKIVVYIDDLDRGWEGKKDDIMRISALLNCLRDMANENPGLYFKISLRSDVYFLVRTSDESTDKIEGSVVWFKWTNHEIFVMLIKRVLTYFNRKIDENVLLESKQKNIQNCLDDILEGTYYGKGKWDKVPTYRVMLSLIRKRPRDMVKLCTLAAKEAKRKGYSIIKTDNFESVLEEYSQGRIQDTINEYKSELPNIEKLIFGMKPNKKQIRTCESFCFSTDELYQKIKNIMQQENFRFSNGSIADFKSLAQFMYKINFLTARKKNSQGEYDRKYFEESRYLSSTFVDYGYEWEIHPAFRWALQPDSLDKIFAQIDL